MAIDKSNLACQVVNHYKGNGGQFVFYVECKPRSMRETDPALSYGKTSLVSFNIFDSKEKRSVVAYLNPEDPAYLYAKVNALLNHGDRLMPAYATTKLKTAPFRGQTAAQAVAIAKLSGNKDSVLSFIKTYKETEDGSLVRSALEANNQGQLVGVPVTLLNECKTPDVSKVDAKGNTDVRVLNISYVPGIEEYKVEISNFKAPPIKGSLVGANFRFKTDEVKYSMTFSELEFFAIVDEVMHAKEMYSKATEGARIRYANENSWKPEQQ